MTTLCGSDLGAYTKQDLRRILRARRACASAEEHRKADERVCARVLATEAWCAAATVYTYLSVRDEVDTRLIVARAWEAGKRVALPRVVPNTRRMRWFFVDTLDVLETNKYHIPEPPLVGCVEADGVGTSQDIALVPGLAFDARGYRMGYGGGFYDTFLAGFAGVSVGLARSYERVETLAYLEPHDRAVDLVVDDG